MRHLSSDQLGDFAAIYEEDVELVSVARPQPTTLDRLAERLFARRQLIHAQWEQAAGDLDAPVSALSRFVEHDEALALSEAIAHASEVLSELLGCDQVGMRVTTLHAPMCPRFHVDQVPCRMLFTLSGPGTEWIPNKDVDWALLADRDTDEPPIRPPGGIRQLATGSWSLLKGGAWDERYNGVVHRSPHGDGVRLLVSLDPLFPQS